MHEIWLVAREMEGWAEAGGVKDVVRDMADAFAHLNWKPFVLLPLYGFLKERVFKRGEKVWSGNVQHPVFQSSAFEVWKVEEGNVTLLFVRSSSYETKKGVYTYTTDEEKLNPLHMRGEGYLDGIRMNLEFQWGVAEYWFQTQTVPELILAHDGHTGFLPAILKTHFAYGNRFQKTKFHLIVHNAGPMYRQEALHSRETETLINLSRSVLRKCTLDRYYDPIVCSASFGRLATVSENYANELTTGRNDHYSGNFGRYLRDRKIPLKGITNGLSLKDKDPRFPQFSKIPVPFDPLNDDWKGKEICRQVLREKILLKPSGVYGRFSRWDAPLYVSQGRLTAQKGVDALIELIHRALGRDDPSLFLVMGVGEKRYEEKMIHLARQLRSDGRFLFVNKYEDEIARLVFAAGDFFLMPSEYEPCGLTDLKAQLMGTLPIVHRVGGLVKVRDLETGYSYSKSIDRGFYGAYYKSLRMYQFHPETINFMRKRAFLSVLEDYQWEKILEHQYIPWLLESSTVA